MSYVRTHISYTHPVKVTQHPFAPKVFFIKLIRFRNEFYDRASIVLYAFYRARTQTVEFDLQ